MKRSARAASALTLLVLSCGGEPFTTAGSAGDGGDASSGSSAGGAGGSSASGGAPSTSGAGGVAGLLGNAATGGLLGMGRRAQIEIQVQRDTDDATWVNGNDERLKFGSGAANLEVGTDREMARSGLRFPLTIPAGARIESASLRLSRTEGDAPASATVLVRVYDSIDVAAFDENHAHAPDEHAPEGFWSRVITSFRVGAAGELVESPDLSELVQHVVDKPGWASGNSIAFVLFPDQMNGWASFADSSAGAGEASLRVAYVEP